MKKPRTVSKLKDDCWKLYSECRRREAALEHKDKYGGQGEYAMCCSCGKVDRWRKMDAGHYVSRNHNNTLYEDCNVHCQCKGCNMAPMNITGYTRFLLARYGTEIIDDLDEMKNIKRQFKPPELLDMEAEFKIRLKELEKVTIS